MNKLPKLSTFEKWLENALKNPFSCLPSVLFHIVICLALFDTFAFAPPDTAKYIKQKAKVYRKNGKLHMLVLPDGRKCILGWHNDSLNQIRYQQNKPFSNKSFSGLAHHHGEGASWYEIPISSSQKKRLLRLFPGLKQQWILKGYESKQSWMGSGIVNDSFFLVLSKHSPITPKKPTAPLALNKNFYRILNTSEHWLPANCDFSASEGECFQSADNPKFRVYIAPKKKAASEIWILEKHDLSGIAQTINQTTPQHYQELSKELAALAQIESHSAITKLFNEIPFLLTWNVWQLQDASDCTLKAGDYLNLLKKSEFSWQSLPIYQYMGKKLNLSIHLFFNGHYKFNLLKK